MVKKTNTQNFISTLLANKKLTNTQRERIAALMIRDLDLESPSQESGSDSNLPKSDLPEYHSPADVMKFLLEYNQDPILKYTCHPIDDMNVINEIAEQCENKVYSVKSHYHLILSSFKQLREKYNPKTTGKYLDGKVLTLMRVYITGETFHRVPSAWSTQSITYNWHSPELWEWSNKTPGIVPNPGENIAEFLCNEGYKLPKPFISNLSGKRINTFGDLVMYYKSLLHIKRDDNLQNKILYIYKKGYQTGDQNSHPWLDRIDLSIGVFDNNIELFTSVDKLLQAFGAILSICIENQVEGIPHVEVGFYRESESKRVCFYVHHKNTQYHKGIEDSIKKIGEKQTLLIKNQINGICDLYIQADFGNDQYAEINLWDGKPREAKNIEKIQGVKYVLKY